MWKGLIFAAFLAMPQVATAGDAGIEATIGGQIAAFRAGDFETAFDYASPTIRGIFRNPRNFEAMVRGGFGVMLNPADMQYLGLRDEGGRTMQRVLYRDRQGEVHLFDYEMIEGQDGWKINGVFPVKLPNVSA